MIKRNLSIFILCFMLIIISSSCENKIDNQPSSSNTSSKSDAVLEGPASSSNNQSKEAWIPDISTVSLYGETVVGSELLGEKLTVMNVWATWCPPCVAELPDLSKVSEDYLDKGVRIVGIMQDGVTEMLELDEKIINDGKTLLEKSNVKYTVILPEEKIMEKFISRMQYFPTTFFLDSEGNVIKTVIGSKSEDEWREKIDETLAELG